MYINYLSYFLTGKTKYLTSTRYMGNLYFSSACRFQPIVRGLKGRGILPTRNISWHGRQKATAFLLLSLLILSTVSIHTQNRSSVFCKPIYFHLKLC